MKLLELVKNKTIIGLKYFFIKILFIHLVKNKTIIGLKYYIIIPLIP